MPEETRLESTAVWCAGSRFHMQIRYGFDVALDLAQPTTILAMMDVHSDLRRCVGEETEFEVAPTIAAERFVDDSGNIVRRLSAPAGPVSVWLQGVFRSAGREDKVVPPLKRSPRRTSRLMRYHSFGAVSGGWARVQAICDFVHQRLGRCTTRRSGLIKTIRA